jgi:hypothetical protein
MPKNVHETTTQRNHHAQKPTFDNASKPDDYTLDRFLWLDQVAADPGMPASAFKVAYAIATSLWRSKGTVTLVTPDVTDDDEVREAWIGTRDLADKIAMSRFTVMATVSRLEERGHLEVDPGKRGRGHSNHYRLVAKGALANPLKGRKAKSKGAPTHLSNGVKGAHSSLLEGEQAKPKANLKGAPTHLSEGEKVRPRTSRGAPTHLNPLYPSGVPSEKERGASEPAASSGPACAHTDSVLEVNTQEGHRESKKPPADRAEPSAGSLEASRSQGSEEDEIENRPQRRQNGPIDDLDIGDDLTIGDQPEMIEIIDLDGNTIWIPSQNDTDDSDDLHDSGLGSFELTKEDRAWMEERQRENARRGHVYVDIPIEDCPF